MRSRKQRGGKSDHLFAWRRRIKDKFGRIRVQDLVYPKLVVEISHPRLHSVGCCLPISVGGGVDGTDLHCGIPEIESSVNGSGITDRIETISRAVVSNQPPTSPEDQVQKHDQQDQAESATAVVADTGAGIVAAAEQQDKEYDNEYERHARKSSTFPALRRPRVKSWAYFSVR